LYWAFIITEGAYLGARVVAWTYDLAAKKYDDIKQFNPTHDVWLLANPMLQKILPVNAPLILDVATGTGRMPRALLSRHRFDGYVIGLDLSQNMLEQARKKLHPHAGRYTLIWHDAQDLPFPDQTFDAVSCLEALEFMPSPHNVLSEMARVLRPGGILLVTNRVNWERKLMPGKAFTDDEMRAKLASAGLVEVEIRPWQVYYDLIWAHKPGTRSLLGAANRDLEQIARCPHCHSTPLARKPTGMYCPHCQQRFPQDRDLVDMH
jgi:ubiquinone/menaquinone biosynthesis C-methylase UbiE